MALSKLLSTTLVPGQAAFMGRAYSKTCPPPPPPTRNTGAGSDSGGLGSGCRFYPLWGADEYGRPAVTGYYSVCAE